MWARKAALWPGRCDRGCRSSRMAMLLCCPRCGNGRATRRELRAESSQPDTASAASRGFETQVPLHATTKHTARSEQETATHCGVGRCRLRTPTQARDVGTECPAPTRSFLDQQRLPAWGFPRIRASGPTRVTTYSGTWPLGDGRARDAEDGAGLSWLLGATPETWVPISDLALSISCFPAVTQPQPRHSYVSGLL